MKRLLRQVCDYDMGKENFGTFVVPKDIDIVDSRTFRSCEHLKTLVVPKFLMVQTDIEIGGIFERNYRLREVLFLPGSMNDIPQVHELVKLFDEFDPEHINIYVENKFVEPFKQELRRTIFDKRHGYILPSAEHFDVLPIEKHPNYENLVQKNESSKGKE